MKHWLTGAILVVLGLFLANLTFHQPPQVRSADGKDEKKQNTVSAAGHGSVRVKADGASISLGLKVSKATLALAEDELKTQATKLREALHDLGIKGLTVQSSPLDVQQPGTVGNFSTAGGLGGMLGGTPGAPSGEPAKPPKPEFTVSQFFVVTVLGEAHLLKSIDQVIRTGLNQGAVTGGVTTTPSSPFGGPGLGGYTQANANPKVEFFLQDDLPTRRKALAQAVAAGLASVKTLANELKVELREITTVSEGQEGFPYQTYQKDTSVHGEIEYRTHVRVTGTY